MRLTPELVGYITITCWVVGVVGLLSVSYAWAFSGGLFSKPLDRLRPGSFCFWLSITGFVAIFVSLNVGSMTCLAGLVFLQQRLCPMLNGRLRDPSEFYYWSVTGAIACITLVFAFDVVKTLWLKRKSKSRKWRGRNLD